MNLNVYFGGNPTFIVRPSACLVAREDYHCKPAVIRLIYLTTL